MKKRSLWTGVLGAAIALTMVARPAFAVQETKIGVTSASNLTTTGFPPVSPEHLLKIGVEVVGDERVVTTKDGRAQLLFLDHSALTVGPNSNIVLDKFAYDPDTGVGELAFSAIKGIFRLVSGKISKKTPVTIKTPVGTIGIRGGIAMVSIQEGGPVEATFLFGKDMTVCSGGTASACVTATRPGSAVTIDTEGNVSAPVILSSDQISGTVQQFEQTPGQITETAVLVFQQEVKDAALGALSEPAAGPGPAASSSTQQFEILQVIEDVQDETKNATDDSGENDTLAETTPPPPPPPPAANLLSGRVKRAVFATGFLGTNDGDPGSNIPFAGATTTGGVLDAMLSSTQQLTINFEPGDFAAASSGPSPFVGQLLGTGTLTADQEFVFYELVDQGNSFDTLAWAGVPTPVSAFPTTGATFYELQPDFVLKSNVPFINGTQSGVSAGGLTVPDPVEAVIAWDLGLFGGAAIVIDGAGTAQQSVGSVFFGPLIGLSDPQTARIAGLLGGSSFLSATDAMATISGSSTFRLSRDGDGTLGNGFFGSANPDYFVLERDPFGGISERVLRVGQAPFTRGYSPNVIALATTPDVLGPRTSRTLNGFAAGLSRRFNGVDVIGAFMFDNTTDNPSDITISTATTTSTILAGFDLQKIGAVGDDNHLVVSFGGPVTSAFFDDERFGALESGIPAQFTTVTNPFLVGAALYHGSNTTGANIEAGFRFTSNSSDFGAASFAVDFQGDFPDVGVSVPGVPVTVVGRELAFELHEGDNVFDFFASSFERAEYGLSLFFNDTGVTFNPVLQFVPSIPGDLVVFANEADGPCQAGAPTGCNVPTAGTLVHAFDSAFGSVAYGGSDEVTLQGGSKVTITNFDADNSPPGNTPFTASFTITVISSGPTGPAVTGEDLYMVTSEAFQSNSFPGAASECVCQFLKWGFWGGEIRFANGDRERIHLANWIAGDNIATNINLPTVGTAVYNGHIIGTVLNAGDVYQAMGGFGMNFNFADPKASTIEVSGFDSVDYNASVTDLTNGIYTASGPDASALGRTMNFTGAFFGGGGDPVAETGGQFNVDGGPDYTASGIFAGAK